MPIRTRAENRPPFGLLSRYIGLETEYATVVEMPPDQQHPPSRQRVYDAVCRSLSKTIPTAKDRFDECQMFLATGGAVSLESSYDWLDQPGGLIEGATPECVSPKDLLIRQRAQDRLFAEAVDHCELPVSIKLLKNSRDDEDHVYGCQENYSAIVASGAMLWLYRAGMVALFPLYMLYVAICLSFIFVSVTVFVSCRTFSGLLRGRKPQIETLFDFPPWSPPRDGPRVASDSCSACRNVVVARVEHCLSTPAPWTHGVPDFAYRAVRFRAPRFEWQVLSVRESDRHQ